MALIALSAFAGTKEDLAKEMLKLMDMQKMTDQLIPQIQQMQMAQMKQMNIPEQDQSSLPTSRKTRREIAWSHELGEDGTGIH